jgi:hypothetical protein
MKTKPYLIAISLTMGSLLSGCRSLGDAGATAAGGAAGGAIVYATGDHRPGAVAAGAAGGAAVTALVTSVSSNSKSHEEGRQEGRDEGYLLGAADEDKRLYFAKRDLEKRKNGEAGSDGRMEYYVWEEVGTTPDGRKLAPQKVAVPVYEPTPVKK